MAYGWMEGIRTDEGAEIGKPDCGRGGDLNI